MSDPESLCTPSEIQQITGRRRAQAQRRWLDQNQWTYAVSYSGDIVIARSHLEAQLNPKITHNTGQDTPDWSALDAT